MLTLAQKIAEKTDSLNLAQIEGLIVVLVENPRISNNKFVQITGLPKETIKDFKMAASFLLKSAENDSISIRDEYLAQIESEHPRAYMWSRIFDLDKFEHVAKKITELRQEFAKLPERSWDQFYATPESTAIKAKVLDDKGLLRQTRIAILGDDDWLSVALSSVIDNGTSITVYEIDSKLLDVLRKITDQKVKFVQYDARKGLPHESMSYDVVVTDPPYTKTGVMLFLTRAIEMLDVSGFHKPKYIYLYYGTSPKTPEKTLKIQEIINQMGLIIEDKMDNIIRYEGAESIGNASSLYVLKTTPFTHVIDRVDSFASLYTFQNVKEEKFPFVDHIVGKLYGVPMQFIKSKSAMRQALGELCNAHKLKVVDEKLTKFNNEGFSVTLILANSNLVMHTWPEFGSIHIDLTTCSPIYKKETLSKSFQALFKAKSVEIRFVE